MNRSRIFQIFSVLTLLCLCAPIVFFGGFASPFQSTKVFYLITLIECALPFYVYLLIAYPTARPNLKHPVTASLLSFIAFMTISAVLGKSPWNSFFGNYMRMDGLLFWYHLILLYFYLETCQRLDQTFFKKALRVFFTIACIQAVVGILQWVKLLPGEHVFDGRASSLSGNPIFFASAIIIPLILAFDKTLNEKSIKTRWLFGLLTVILLTALLGTGTRGALVGLVGGFITWAITKIFLNQNSAARKKYLFISAICLSVIVLSFFTLRTFASPDSFTYHITHTNASVGSRLKFWEISVLGWKDSPLFGVGSQNFYVVSDKYYSKDLYTLENSWPDKPHNQLLEILVTGGIFAFIAYLALLFFVSKTIFSYRKQRNGIANIALFSALIAYVTQNLFIFDTVDPLVVFFFFLAFVSFSESEKKPETSSINQKKHFAWILCFIPISVFILYTIPTMKEFYAIKPTLEISPDRAKAFQALEKIRQQSFIYDTGFLANTYQKLLNLELSANKKNTPLSDQIFEAIKETFPIALTREPLRTNYWYLYSISYMLNATASGTKVPPEGFNIAEHAFNLAPNRIEALDSLANMYDINGDDEKALALIEQASINAPNNPELLWTFALFYLKQNQKEKAVDVAMKSLEYELQLNNSIGLNWLINYFVEKNDHKKVVYLYKKAVKFEPQNFELLPKLAAAYANNGQKEKAIETANLLLQHDPKSRQEVEMFIQSLP